VPYLRELLGDGFRLDHLYGIVMRAGAEGHVLHGGGVSNDPTHFYRFNASEMRSGLTVATWVLTDHGPGDGGFACIAGSHKSNFPTPRDVARLETDIGVVRQVEAPGGFGDHLHRGPYPRHDAVEGAARAAGDALQVLAGKRQLRADYLPQGVAEVIEEFTPAQRAVLEPPYHPSRPAGSSD
jgi:hypothetical protein